MEEVSGDDGQWTHQVGLRYKIIHTLPTLISIYNSMLTSDGLNKPCLPEAFPVPQQGLKVGTLGELTSSL